MLFSETPQGVALMRRIEAASSNWAHAELLVVYRKARDYYESNTNSVLSGQPDAVSSTDRKENLMSLEQALAANTAALEANTAALLKGAVAAVVTGEKATTTSTGSTAKEKATPAKEKATATKEKTAASKHSREDMVAALTEVKEKFDVESTRALFQKHAEKMKDIPDSAIDEIYLAAKEKLAEGEGGEGDGL